MKILVVFALCSWTAVLSDDESKEKVKIAYETPVLEGTKSLYLFESFESPQFADTWIKSQSKKQEIQEEISKYDGVWLIEPAAKDSLTGDMGLVLKSKAKHAAISAALKRPFQFTDKHLIVQYEVQFQEGQECGGAYLKLLMGDKPIDLGNFHDKTPYTIMFGPDKCGNDHKLHFIFRHKNPKTKEYEEKHCKKPRERLEDYFTDKKPHLYTLVIKPDNTFSILVDHKEINSGSLLEDFSPPVNPPKEIDDPKDKKPEDWDDREKIPDETATKPDDWNESAPQMIEDESASIPEGWLENEPKHIPDPVSEKPSDWDEEIDGEWQAPLVDNPACEDAPGCGPWSPPIIPNPAYKGKWHPPMIDNPNYQGVWKPRRISNPDFFEDLNPFRMSPIAAVGFELWSMSANILFDNVIVTSDFDLATIIASKTYDLKMEMMKQDADSLLNKFLAFSNAYPWSWAVYVVLLLIPVIVVAIFCCGSPSQKERERMAADALRKKTDEVVADDQPADEEPGNKILSEPASDELGATTQESLSQPQYGEEEEIGGVDEDENEEDGGEQNEEATADGS